jgi:hypothetical protein
MRRCRQTPTRRTKFPNAHTTFPAHHLIIVGVSSNLFHPAVSDSNSNLAEKIHAMPKKYSKPTVKTAEIHNAIPENNLCRIATQTVSIQYDYSDVNRSVIRRKITIF